MTARPSEWKALLDKALPALDHVFGKTEGTRPKRPAWTLGGGTAIAIQLDHRVSYDVDLFVPGTALREFTPARNPAARLISGTYQWPGHYLKFELPEGEIDFLSPALQTEPGFIWRTYRNRLLALETPEEVIIKKIRYRSHAFTPRDAFDLAAVALERSGLAGLMAAETGDALPRLEESLRILEAKGQTDLSMHVVLTHKGRGIAGHALRVAQETTRQALDLTSPTRGPSPAEVARFLSGDGNGIGE